MLPVSPRLKTVLIVVIVIIALVAISVLVWYLLKPSYNLVAMNVNTEPQIDGKLDEADWAKAETLVIPTEKGPDIELKALYTPDKIFVSARYPDATKNDLHQPWTFNGKSWTQGGESDGLVMFFESGDSIEGFDTKGFNVMDKGLGAYNELYQFSITKKKQATGYAPGYQGRADIWILGAGFTNAYGQADDAWFGVDANYLASPAGQKANLITQWDEFTTPATINLNITRWQEAIKTSEGGTPDTSVPDRPYLTYSDETMTLDNAPYPTANQLTTISSDAVFKKGDTAPFVYFNNLAPGHWGGSRDDVAGKMVWKDGWWTIEFSRKLDTGNADDIVFQTGKGDSYHFGTVIRRDGRRNIYSVPATLKFLPKGGG